jgi:hypothetical protein
MAENPYQAPQTKSQSSAPFTLWYSIGVVAAVIYGGSVVVREFTVVGTTVNDYARIVREIGGALLLVWCGVALAMTTWSRRQTRAR